MVGRRWDLDIAEALHFTTAFKDTDWKAHLRTQVLHKARRRGPEWIDYFVFSRGLFGEKMPSFCRGPRLLGQLAGLEGAGRAARRNSKMAAQERSRSSVGRLARLHGAMEEGARAGWICAPG